MRQRRGYVRPPFLLGGVLVLLAVSIAGSLVTGGFAMSRIVAAGWIATAVIFAVGAVLLFRDFRRVR